MVCLPEPEVEDVGLFSDMRRKGARAVGHGAATGDLAAWNSRRLARCESARDAILLNHSREVLVLSRDCSAAVSCVTTRMSLPGN